MTLRTVSSTVVFENPVLSVRQDEVERDDGWRGTYVVVDRPDISLVVPAERDGLHLVEQYRYSTGTRSWEFPSGSRPRGEPGTPEELAVQELREETGFTAGAWERLGFLHVANGTTGEGVHVFLATDLHPGDPELEPAEEDMRVRWVRRDEVERMVRDGEITDAATVAAYLLWSVRAS